MKVVLFEKEFLPQMVDDFELDRRSILLQYKNLPEAFFCALEDDKVLGFVSISFEKFKYYNAIAYRLPFAIPSFFSKLLYKLRILREPCIAQIIVQKAHRGKGIGKLLMASGEDYVKNSLKSKHIFLMVRKTNEVALNLYKNIGYEIIGEYKPRKKIIMRKSLS